MSNYTFSGLLINRNIFSYFFSSSWGRWQVCKVIHVSAPEECARHIVSYPLLQPRERSFELMMGDVNDGGRCYLLTL